MLAAAPCAQSAEISFYYPVAVGGPIAERMDALAREFEASHPGIRVTPIYSGTYKESIFKALTAHKRGTPPTAAVLFSADLLTLIDADAIVPFDELATTAADQAWLQGFYPAFMANSRAGGKTWGIPFQRSNIVLYWNKAQFAAAGLDPERPPQTWPELVADAQRLTQRTNGGAVRQWGVEIPSTGFPYWFLQALAATNATDLANADGNAVHFNDPQTVAALAFWLDLSAKYRVHPSGLVEWGRIASDFLGGRTAMILTTSGNLRNIAENAPFAFGVAMLPAGSRRASPTGGGNFYLFRRAPAEQREAAFEFVKWMTQPERAAQWSIDTGYVAVRPDAWETARMRAHVQRFPLARVAFDQLEYAVPELATHENQRVTNALNEAIAIALAGTRTPAQALNDAQAKAERILLPYRREP